MSIGYAESEIENTPFQVDLFCMESRKSAPARNVPIGNFSCALFFTGIEFILEKIAFKTAPENQQSL